MSPARAWLGQGPPPRGPIVTFGGGPWASISKAKSIEKVSISANPGVGSSPPRKGHFVGGPQESTQRGLFLKDFALQMASWAGARSPAFSAGGSPPPKNGPASAVGPPWAPLASPREGVFAHPVGLS